MKTNNLIHITQVSTHYNVDISFIQSLHELGHVALIIENNNHYILDDQLKTLESLIHFHTELQINIEGIDVIAHLLNRIEVLQNELLTTKNKLIVYSTD